MFYIFVAGYIFYICFLIYVFFKYFVVAGYADSLHFIPTMGCQYHPAWRRESGKNNHHSILVIIIIMLIMISSEWYYQIGSVWVPKARVDKCLLRRQGSYQGGDPIVFLGWQRQRLQQRHHRQKQSQRQLQ